MPLDSTLMDSATPNPPAGKLDFPPHIDSILHKFWDLPSTQFCSGTVPLVESSSTIFFRNGAESNFVDFFNLEAHRVEALAQACEPATFGVGSKDVLDDTYRKAGKLDTSAFATQFSPATNGIIESIANELFATDPESSRDLQVELYKLNVYGPGSFFKAHVDTPRSETIVGSLVVIFPTPHEGGVLHFRKGGEEWTFDSAAVTASHATPHAAYVAFYSDLEHEVSPVSTGHRVTLTYNLYVKSKDPQVTTLEDTGPSRLEQTMMQSISALLADPAFLPSGGLMGFPLSHIYPFEPEVTQMSTIQGCLKGLDVNLSHALRNLRLSFRLKAMYRLDTTSSIFCMLNNFVKIPDSELENFDGGLLGVLASEKDLDALVVYDARVGLEAKHSSEEYYITRRALIMNNPDPKPIVWIEKTLSSTSVSQKFNMERLASPTRFKAPYIAYGNQASMKHAYGELCFVVDVKTAGERVLVL